ncbi:VWA domain-containing protein [Oceaniserpentilla sp. 4NH20-0058]|uniref:vWA domain-containing protein n=1 Tax=Oceaniserpentilla sp. 4NH20-0058 TaxID=3127660 RepID=UPI00310A9FB3
MLSFNWPWLFLALPLPLFVYFLIPAKQTMQSQVFAPSLMMLAEQRQIGAQKPSIVLYILMALAWFCLVTAAARPVYVGEPKPIIETDRNMMLAVDISGSMSEEDMAVRGRLINRLQAVKVVLTDFIAKRKGDRLGLILFGSKAYIQTPLTFDLQTLEQLLNESAIGLAGKQTAIGDAIGLGVKRLQSLPESNRVLIFLTDGQNTSGEIDPIQAAKLAQQAGVKIYTIGIGADELVVQGFFGPRRVNPSRDLDEKTLTEVADLTGGQYFRARNLEELNQIYSFLDDLEAIESDKQVIRPEKSLFHYVLAFALGLATVIFMIQQRWLNKLIDITSPNKEKARV